MNQRNIEKSVKDTLQLTPMGEPLIASAICNCLVAAIFSHCGNDGKKRKTYLL